MPETEPAFAPIATPSQRNLIEEDMAFKSEKDHSLFSGAPASNKTRLGEIEMIKPLIDLPRNSQIPLNVHINRNGFKESLHQVDVAVCDADGSVILGMGDVESVIFPRSAMKPLQSIALIELLKTVEDIPEISEAEVALICASHNGETLHTEAVQGLLGKFDAVLRQVRETTQCAHGDLILILVGLLPVIVGRRAEGQDYLAVALSSERTGFQQRLGIEETARIGVLARLDIIQRIPAKIQGLPEFVREEVFGIVPDPLLQGFNVHLRIPPLDDSGPANRLRRANIVLAE